MTPSIHDNVLLSYCVLADRREIRFHTSYAQPDTTELTDVVFEGVAGYFFEMDDFSTIIFGVDETEASAVYDDYKELFNEGRRYGWPGYWNRSEADALAYFAEHNIRGYWLTSSIGMSGWVLAERVSIVTVND